MQLRSMGAGTSRQIARAVGRSPQCVHYHLTALVAVGLARIASKRPAPKKPEAIYEPIGRNLRLPRPGESAELTALSRRAVESGLKSTLRGYHQASIASENEPKLARRLHVLRINLRLSSKDIDRFLQLVEEASKFAEEHRDENGERLVWSSVVFPPMVKGKGEGP